MPRVRGRGDSAERKGRGVFRHAQGVGRRADILARQKGKLWGWYSFVERKGLYAAFLAARVHHRGRAFHPEGIRTHFMGRERIV